MIIGESPGTCGPRGGRSHHSQSDSDVFMFISRRPFLHGEIVGSGSPTLHSIPRGVWPRPPSPSRILDRRYLCSHSAVCSTFSSTPSISLLPSLPLLPSPPVSGSGLRLPHEHQVRRSRPLYQHTVRGHRTVTGGSDAAAGGDQSECPPAVHHPHLRDAER